MEKWSVIACDQYSSEPNYWKSLDEYIGDAPSALRLMLPEAYLGGDEDGENDKIIQSMHQYLDGNVFRTIENSYILVERTLPGGSIRKGLVGALNLDTYDYSPVSSSPVRATENTVEDRLPPRIKIRYRAPLEMPHIMVFVNDPENILFGGISGNDVLYDFNLNMGGGHIKGSRISGASADNVDRLLSTLEASLPQDSPVMAVGDGNHSLAAAKKCGSRYALVELVNIYDPSIVFEPIHRVLFSTDTRDFDERLSSLNLEGIAGYADKINAADEFCKEYVAKHGGYIDYIHDDATAIEMGSRPGCAALLLPAMNRDELFPYIKEHGVYPKKSFSIGCAADKRYYLECALI